MEIGTLIRELGGGMWISAEIFILTLLFSLPLGLVVAFGRMSKIAPVRWISKLYISIMRGTPLMLQLMVVYFGPYYLFGMRISTGYRMTAVLIGFAINYAAYFAEIYRGGIEAIPVGQYEAAKVLGYSKSQTFFRIVFPLRRRRSAAHQVAAQRRERTAVGAEQQRAVAPFLQAERRIAIAVLKLHPQRFPFAGHRSVIPEIVPPHRRLRKGQNGAGRAGRGEVNALKREINKEKQTLLWAKRS